MTTANAMNRICDDYLRMVIMPEVGMIHHWMVEGNNLVYHPYQDDGRVGEKVEVPMMTVMAWASRRM